MRFERRTADKTLKAFFSRLFITTYGLGNRSNLKKNDIFFFFPFQAVMGSVAHSEQRFKHVRITAWIRDKSRTVTGELLAAPGWPPLKKVEFHRRAHRHRFPFHYLFIWVAFCSNFMNGADKLRIVFKHLDTYLIICPICPWKRTNRDFSHLRFQFYFDQKTDIAAFILFKSFSGGCGQRGAYRTPFQTFPNNLLNTSQILDGNC